MKHKFISIKYESILSNKISPYPILLEFNRKNVCNRKKININEIKCNEEI